MSEPTNPLLALSHSLSGLVGSVADSLIAVISHGRLVASGFAWKADAAVTASDALEADDEISLLLADGRTLAATLKGRDPSTDVALIAVREGTLQPLPNTAAKAVRVGELVLALGRGKEGVTANLGIVSTAGGPWQSLRGGNIDCLIRLDMRLEPLREGALVIDAQGATLGMGVLGPRRRPLVIPMATIERIAPRLLADGRIRRGYLGLGLQSLRLDEALAQAHALPSRRGIMVVSLDPNGPARAAGVHVGDIIISLDGEAVPGV
ncbi:MAG: trypsin-like peptidase domain-containing protein, partial [Hyphomicrobiaceae bacterium]|nr:trypsin-like peptidase domain-containing protein [Hyphomicrobiaceae bacterium]